MWDEQESLEERAWPRATSTRRPSGETREQALAAGDFDALRARHDGDGGASDDDEHARAWPEVDEIAGAQPAPAPMSRARRRRRLLGARGLRAGGDRAAWPRCCRRAATTTAAAATARPRRRSSASGASAPTLGEAAALVQRDDYGAALAKARALPADQELRVRNKIGRRLAERAMIALEAGDRAGAERLLSEAAAYPESAQVSAARERLRRAR